MGTVLPPEGQVRRSRRARIRTVDPRLGAECGAMEKQGPDFVVPMLSRAL